MADQLRKGAPRLAKWRRRLRRELFACSVERHAPLDGGSAGSGSLLLFLRGVLLQARWGRRTAAACRFKDPVGTSACRLQEAVGAHFARS